MMREYCLKMALMGFVIFIMLPLAHAVGIGASPGSLYFSNMTRNGYAEDYLTISTTSQEPLQIGFRIEGELQDWVRIEKPDMELAFGRPVDVKVIVSPPAEAQNGVRDGTIIIYVLNEQTGEGVSTKILPGIAIDLSVEIIGEQQLSCKLERATIENIEAGYPMELNTIIKNTGNVNLRPQITLDIWDKEQEGLIASETITADNIRPTSEASFMKKVIVNLKPGQYWADVQIPECNEYSMITFDVVEKGMIVDKGEIIRLDAPENLPIVPVTAYFKNIGSRVVSAKMKGKIYDGDRIIKTLETDSIDVPANALQKFEAYFEPQKPGKYRIEVQVLYNNKLTYSKQLNVEVSQESLENQITGAVAGKGIPGSTAPFMVIIAVIVVFLLLIIRRKRRLNP